MFPELLAGLHLRLQRLSQVPDPRVPIVVVADKLVVEPWGNVPLLLHLQHGEQLLLQDPLAIQTCALDLVQALDLANERGRGVEDARDLPGRHPRGMFLGLGRKEEDKKLEYYY